MRLTSNNLCFLPLLALYNYPTSLCNTAILLILLPLQITNMGFDEIKGTVMGISVASASFVAVLFYPIVGYYSDRLVRTWYGKRIPFMVIGTIILLFSCLVLGMAFNLYILIPGLMFWQLSYSFFTGPYYALMPDIVPPQNWGSASGWIGFITLFGYLSGAVFSFIVGYLTFIEIYLIICFMIIITSIIPFIFIGENRTYLQPNAIKSCCEWFSAFSNKNYRWVYIMRFFMSVSVFLVQQYLQYYIQDVVSSYNFLGINFTNPERVTGLLLFLILIGAMSTSIIAGKLADKISRRILVYIGAFVQIGATICLILYPKLELIIPVSIIFGLGYGAYNAADFALAADVLPNGHYRARDLGIWHSALSLPSAFVTPLAGLILDVLESFSANLAAKGNHKDWHLGYIVLFLASIFFSLGSVAAASQLDFSDENKYEDNITINPHTDHDQLIEQ